METEGPYTYPLTDRADIIKFLAEHQVYYSDNGLYLAWNIKVNYRFDTSGAAYRDDFKFEERFDEAWAEVVEEDSEMFWRVCEDATSMYTEEEWTRYPGVEQGEWKFGIQGQSGGWMLLEGWPGPGTAAFHGRARSLIWHNRDHYQEWLEELDEYHLNLFYKAIVQLDQDLSDESCRQDIEYQYAARREVWEIDRVEDEEEAARKLEASRPDMYRAVQEVEAC